MVLVIIQAPTLELEGSGFRLPSPEAHGLSPETLNPFKPLGFKRL